MNLNDYEDEKIFDSHGVQLNLRDYILYAATDGNSPVIQYGCVVSLKLDSDLRQCVGAIAIKRAEDGGWIVARSGQEVTIKRLSEVVRINVNMMPFGTLELISPFVTKKLDKETRSTLYS